MIFPVVLQQYDDVTGTTKDLNVDEAITACDDFFKGDKSMGSSASSLMKVIRNLAIALAQVCSEKSVGLQCCCMLWLCQNLSALNFKAAVTLCGKVCCVMCRRCH